MERHIETLRLLVASCSTVAIAPVVSVGAGVFVVVIAIGAFEIVARCCCADTLPTTSMNATDVPSSIALCIAATWSGTPFRRCCLVDPAVNVVVLWS